MGQHFTCTKILYGFHQNLRSLLCMHITDVRYIAKGKKVENCHFSAQNCGSAADR